MSKKKDDDTQTPSDTKDSVIVNNVVDIKEAKEKRASRKQTVLVQQKPLFRMPFEDVDNVHWAILQSFYPDGIPDDGPEERVESVIIHFFTVANWSRDEYWEEMERRDDHVCPHCEAEQEALEDDNEPTDNKPN
jgi:hypothetical protein